MLLDCDWLILVQFILNSSAKCSNNTVQKEFGWGRVSRLAGGVACWGQVQQVKGQKHYQFKVLQPVASFIKRDKPRCLTFESIHILFYIGV
jgi:hypothetical protein